jgi:hypothetical protein
MLSRITRRNILKVAVAGVGSAAVGVYFLDKSCKADYSHPAYLYWDKNTPGALHLTRYLALCASLAPSPHNTQPWRFVAGKNEINVFADRTRNLGRGDADFRMMLMSIGCAVENIHIAALQLGYDARVAAAADTEFARSGFCARIVLAPQSEPVKHALFDSIFQRQTTRAPFLNSAVPAALTQSISGMNDSPDLTLHWFDQPQDIAKINRVHGEAVRSFVASAAYQDGLKWWRYTRDEMLARRDGISIFTSCAPGLIKQYFQISVDQAAMSGQFGQDGEIELMDKLFAATPLWGAITSKQTGNNARLEAGRLLERVYLETTRQNYQIMPVAYVPEQPEHAATMKTLFDIPREHELLSVFRIGRAQTCERSVRRLLSDVVAVA